MDASRVGDTRTTRQTVSILYSPARYRVAVCEFARYCSAVSRRISTLDESLREKSRGRHGSVKGSSLTTAEEEA